MTSTTRQGVGPEDSLGDSDASDRQDREAGTVLVGPDSDQTPVLSVVMPTLNEEEGIAECIDRVTTAVRELGVPTEVVVSDSSTDRTPETERENGATGYESDIETAVIDGSTTEHGERRFDYEAGIIESFSARWKALAREGSRTYDSIRMNQFKPPSSRRAQTSGGRT